MRNLGQTSGTAICLCATALLALAWQQVGATAQRVELTRTDLFARKDWKSTEVEVAGFYLGMTRNEARANARRDGFQLMQDGPDPTRPGLVPCSGTSECYLMSVNGRSGDNLTFRFSKGQTVEEIYIVLGNFRGRTLREAKGQTSRFLNGPYSDTLRLELFGRETTRELVDGGYTPVKQDTRYVYSERGLTITVSPGPDGPWIAAIGFVVPSGPGR